MNNRIKTIAKTGLFFGVLVFFNACVEWGETLTFDIINNTERAIKIRQIGITCYNCPLDTTINLSIGEKISNDSHEDSGNAPEVPFREISKMIFIYNDSIQKEYTRDMVGKNPLSKEYYIETSKKEKNRITMITYEYSIEEKDFE